MKRKWNNSFLLLRQRQSAELSAKKKKESGAKLVFPSFVWLSLCVRAFSGDYFVGRWCGELFLSSLEEGLQDSSLLCPECRRTSQRKYLSFIFSVLLTHRRFTAAHVALPPFFLTPKAGAESASPFYLKFMWESSDFYFLVSLLRPVSSPYPHGWCKKEKKEHMRFVETHSRLHNHRDITLEKDSNNTKCFVCSLTRRLLV